MSVLPWFPLPVPCKVQWILILVNVTTACLICTASPHTFWQSQHILGIIGWRSHWKREGRHCVRIHSVTPSRRGVASSISGVFGVVFFFALLGFTLSHFFYLCWFYNLCSVPYVFLILLRFGIFRVWWFGVWQFGILLQWFFFVRCYFFLCTWYVFWYLVAFIIVILLHEEYHFRYFGSSLFRIVFRILVFCSYFFCILCFCTTCCIWCIVI